MINSYYAIPNYCKSKDSANPYLCGDRFKSMIFTEIYYKKASMNWRFGDKADIKTNRKRVNYAMKNDVFAKR